MNICRNCGVKNESEEFKVPVTTGYGNKGNSFLFCSAACRDDFVQSKLCCRCHRTTHLHRGADNLLYCDYNPNDDLTCWDLHRNMFRCALCLDAKEKATASDIFADGHWRRRETLICSDCKTALLEFLRGRHVENCINPAECNFDCRTACEDLSQFCLKLK